MSDEHVTWNMRYVMEGSLRESVRAFLVPVDVLSTCTTAGKWNVAGVVWGLCRTPLFPHEERCEERTWAPLLKGRP